MINQVSEDRNVEMTASAWKMSPDLLAAWTSTYRQEHGCKSLLQIYQQNALSCCMIKAFV